MEISLFFGVNIMFITVKFMAQLLNGFMLNFTGVPNNVPSQFALRCFVSLFTEAFLHRPSFFYFLKHLSAAQNILVNPKITNRNHHFM